MGIESNNNQHQSGLSRLIDSRMAFIETLLENRDGSPEGVGYVLNATTRKFIEIIKWQHLN